MGHLVNPIAFRLGWSRQWIDDYFIDLRFYPELLHRLLRFRYFLNCFFSAKVPHSHFDVYLISHFTFFFDLRGFGLQVFYYNSRMDPCWYDFSDKIAQKPYGLRFFPKKRHEAPTFAPWNRKFLSLLFILYHYAVNGVFDEPYRYRLSFFKAFQDTLQPNEFALVYPKYVLKKYHKRHSSFSLSERECYVLLHMMRYRTLQEIGRINYTFRGYGLRMVNYEAVAQTFFRILYVHHMTKPYMHSFFNWLQFLGYFFFFGQPFTVRFFQVNNDQLSARFLAKFLAIRFRQGFTVRAALKPIRKDLRLSKKLAKRMHHKVSAMNRTKFERSGRGKISSFFPLFFSSMAYSYRLLFSRKCTASFDLFFLTFRLQQQKSTKKLKRLFKRCYKFIRLFFERRLLFSFVNHITADAKKLFFFKGYFFGYFSEMVFDRFLSYHHGRSLLKKGTNAKDYESFLRPSPAALFHLTGGVLASFLNFSAQSSAPPRSLDTVFSTKRRTFRQGRPPALGLQGFRIRLHGRFTRKQIAASYHFQEGAMPLSTMSCFIDYGFATIPLRNSSIGIKVWLFKGGSPEVCELNYSFN